MKKILIAEDEKPMAHALELKLSKSDFAVVVVNDGEEAIRALEKEKFDLVLLDIMMPKVDGFKVLQTMNESKNHTPVMVSSNLGQEEDIKRATSLGAVDYIIKSNTPIAEVVDKIKNILK